MESLLHSSVLRIIFAFKGSKNHVQMFAAFGLPLRNQVKQTIPSLKITCRNRNFWECNAELILHSENS